MKAILSYSNLPAQRRYPLKLAMFSFSLAMMKFKRSVNLVDSWVGLVERWKVHTKKKENGASIP